MARSVLIAANMCKQITSLNNFVQVGKCERWSLHMERHPRNVLNLQNVAVDGTPKGWLLEHCIYNRSALREERFVHDGVTSIYLK